MAKLGEKGGREHNPVAGSGGPFGRKRNKPDPARIAARVARLDVASVRATAPGVQPLNPGFFKIERIRSATVAKKKAAVKRKARG